MQMMTARAGNKDLNSLPEHFYKPCDCRTLTKNNYHLYRFVQLFAPAAKTLFHTAGAQEPRPSLF